MTERRLNRVNTIVRVNYGKVCDECGLTADAAINALDPLAGSGGMLVAFA
jgi:hypothetical protein